MKGIPEKRIKLRAVEMCSIEYFRSVNADLIYRFDIITSLAHPYMMGSGVHNL